MKNTTTRKKFVAVWIGCFASLVFLGLGCSGSSSGGAKAGTVTVTTLLTADLQTLARAEADAPPTQFSGPVEVGDIESLTLTITEVSLDRAGADDEDDKIVVYSGEMDVNILDLMHVSEVLSSATLPAGIYDKIRLSITDPRLIFKSDLRTVITDIHLTANGRLFVSESFELPRGESYLLILNFVDIHLVELGNGGYVLTPQLRADIDIEPTEVSVSGMIITIDRTADTVVIALTDGTTIDVYYDGTLIFLPGDTITANGTENDLVEGLEVVVTGMLWVDGSLTADSIEII